MESRSADSLPITSVTGCFWDMAVRRLDLAMERKARSEPLAEAVMAVDM